MYTVYVHPAHQHLAQRNPPKGRDYFDRFDARTVARIELNDLLREHPNAVVENSSTDHGVCLWLVTLDPGNSTDVTHIYVLDEEREMINLSSAHKSLTDELRDRFRENPA